MKKLKIKINYKIIKKNLFLHKYIKCKNINYKYKQYFMKKCGKLNLIIDYNYNTCNKDSYLLDGTNKCTLKVLNTYGEFLKIPSEKRTQSVFNKPFGFPVN